MIYAGGDREAGEGEGETARTTGRRLAGSFGMSNVSPLVISALRKNEAEGENDALAVVECRTVSSGIAAADSAVKRSAVRLLKLVTGQGNNGKSYFVLCGYVAAVTEAVEAAKEALGPKLIETVVLPRPDASVLKAVTGVAR